MIASRSLSESVSSVYLRILFLTMRIVIQKVKRASVTVDSEIVSSIEKGLLLLVGISTDDNEKIVDAMASKVAKLRMFEDEEGKNLWKSTTRQANGQILSVSQFTLMANTKKGTKPDLHKAAKGPQAQPLYELFLQRLREDLGDENVKDGVFGAMMDVALVNDGPVTIQLDSDDYSSLNDASKKQ